MGAVSPPNWESTLQTETKFGMPINSRGTAGRLMLVSQWQRIYDATVLKHQDPNGSRVWSRVLLGIIQFAMNVPTYNRKFARQAKEYTKAWKNKSVRVFQNSTLMVFSLLGYVCECVFSEVLIVVVLIALVHDAASYAK